jgi:hypothetical protein
MPSSFKFEKPCSSSNVADTRVDMEFIRNLDTCLWEIFKHEYKCREFIFGEQYWNTQPIGTPFKLMNGKITSVIKVQLLTGTDNGCTIYNNASPPLGCVRRDRLTDSTVMNALRTGATAVAGTWMHKQYDHLEMSVVFAFVAAFGMYVIISFLLYRITGFVGDSVSMTEKIVLDKEASGLFCKCLHDATLPANDLVCLDLDNSMFWPTQSLHFAYRITSFALVT